MRAGYVDVDGMGDGFWDRRYGVVGGAGEVTGCFFLLNSFLVNIRFIRSIPLPFNFSITLSLLFFSSINALFWAFSLFILPLLLPSPPGTGNMGSSPLPSPEYNRVEGVLGVSRISSSSLRCSFGYVRPSPCLLLSLLILALICVYYIHTSLYIHNIQPYNFSYLKSVFLIFFDMWQVTT